MGTIVKDSSIGARVLGLAARVLDLGVEDLRLGMGDRSWTWETRALPRGPVPKSSHHGPNRRGWIFSNPIDGKLSIVTRDLVTWA